MRFESLADSAMAVLRANDLGDWTKPAPRLYPHQWSWDSAFVSIGLAPHNPERALRELESLFAAQWTDGRVPHIVFNPQARDYFPGPDRWASVATNPAAPRDRATSGLIQPPVHGLALQRVLDVVRARGVHELEPRIEQLYGKMLDWHRYLASARDPSGDGLLIIYHPWESGTDNSPRWDDALGRVEVGDMAPYQRHDIKHVADSSERPTQSEYDRYLWLVELLKQDGYDDQRIQRNYPFLIADVLMSGIFAAANHALADVAEKLGRPRAEQDWLRQQRAVFGEGVQRAWDAELRLVLDRDLRGQSSVRVETCAGLAALLVSNASSDVVQQTVERLEGSGFAGAPGLALPVVPSTAPGSRGFQPRRYWRGPSWPVANWLLWWGLRQHGRDESAARLRKANLELLNRPDARLAEYYEPYTAEPLGSIEQSWTAAVALDWLNQDAD